MSKINESNLDEFLYEKYLNGDKEAFETLYNKYKNGICYFVYNIVKNYEQAEDITQEVFIYVLQNGVNNDYPFKNYLYLIARSKAVNYFNKQKRREEIDEEYLRNSNKDVEQDIADIIIKSENKKELINSIEKLDEKYRNVVYLVCIEDMSYKAVSQVLGISLSNVKILVHRGKKELKKNLIKERFENMNKVAKVLLVLIVVGILSSGIVYGAAMIYKEVVNNIETKKANEVKSYEQAPDDEVVEPLSSSKAPVGEFVFKSFEINEDEKNSDLTDLDDDGDTYYKKIENYEEYEKLMNRYENLRKLTRDDFDSYFAEIIISKNDSTKLRYRRVTYDYGNYEGDPFLNINIIKEKVDDTENLKGQALVLIMTRRCLDYNVRPLIVE